MFTITKVSTFYKGRCRITREHTVNAAATMADVERILSLPESYDGEREEARQELSVMGITSYAKHMISEI